MIIATLAESAAAIRWTDLNLDPILVEFGFVKIRWYSLAYIGAILLGWWMLLKMVALPGAPFARRHVDDFVFYATLGIILGGRLGYILFYKQSLLLDPWAMLKLWEGGMSFHGGLIGVAVAISWLVWRDRLNWLRVADYVVSVVPPGMFFGRIANFINGELWGREAHVAWAMIFPGGGDVARHPSQLYEALMEGLLLALIMIYAFWKTDARYAPGRLAGIFGVGMGVSRFIVEFFREPDAGVFGLGGFTMGQTLSIPMILVGLYLIATSGKRRVRVEPVSGETSVS